MIRAPAYAGSFYPSDSIELKRIVTRLLRDAKSEEQESFGCVVPHAGYVFSGATAACAYKSLPKKLEKKTFIILGVDHAGNALGASVFSSGSWGTPLGNVRIDEAVAKKLLNSSELFKDDQHAHAQEHSIEVQIPFLQCRFNNFKIVPVSLSSFLDPRALKEISRCIPDDCYLIASSDLTHHGIRYGYTPFTGGRMDIVAQIKKMDKRIISYMAGCNMRLLGGFMRNTGNTTCGVAPVTVMCEKMKRLGFNGRLLDYSTSFAASKDISGIVGYASIIFK